MFGSLGGSEVIFIFILALLLFGPRKLPEIGRTLGKAMSEFRKATQDFRTSLEREVELDKIKETTQSIVNEVRPTFSRGALLDGLMGEPPAAHPPAPPAAGAAVPAAGEPPKEAPTAPPPVLDDGSRPTS